MGSGDIIKKGGWGKDGDVAHQHQLNWTIEREEASRIGATLAKMIATVIFFFEATSPLGQRRE